MLNRLRLSLIPVMLIALILASPSQAFIGIGGIVFDPKNYSQNILTAVRTLTMVKNQIQQLEHEADMLLNQAKNLTRLKSSAGHELQFSISQINQILGRAERIAFKVSDLEHAWTSHYGALPTTSTPESLQTASESRFENSQAALLESLTIGTRVAEEIPDDARTLARLMQSSLGAQGALNATQAGNEILSFTAKQQTAMQAMMAAHYRARDLEAARQIAERTASKKRQANFLGAADAYTRS